MFIPLDGVTSRMISELRGLNNPPRDVQNIFNALLWILSPELREFERTWEEALSMMADSKKFIKRLELINPKKMSTETIKKIKKFCEEPSPCSQNQTANMLKLWVISMYKTSTSTRSDSEVNEPTIPEVIQQLIVTPKKRNGIASVSSSCVVLGTITDLPIIKVSDKSVTILRKNNSLLWCDWVPQPSLPIFTFDTCHWCVSNKIFNKKLSTSTTTYKSTLSDLVHNAIAGHPVCLCIAGSKGSEYLLGRELNMTSIIEQVFDEIQLLTRSLENVKIKISNVAGGDCEDEICTTTTTIQQLTTSKPEELDNCVLTISIGDAYKNIYFIICNDNDSVLSSIHTWAVTTNEGGTRLASHHFQSIAADAFGPNGFVRLLCVIDGNDQKGDIRNLSYMQVVNIQHNSNSSTVSKNTSIPTVEDAQKIVLPLRKSDLSVLRTKTPGNAVRAATESALLCCGIGTGGVSPVSSNWDSVRRCLCDPGIVQSIKKSKIQTQLPEPAWRRLHVLIKRFQSLPWSSDDCSDITNIGVMLARWSLSVIAIGLVKRKPSSRSNSIGKKTASPWTAPPSSKRSTSVNTTARELLKSLGSPEKVISSPIKESDEQGISSTNETEIQKSISVVSVPNQLSAEDELKQLTTLTELTTSMRELEERLVLKDSQLLELKKQLAQTRGKKKTFHRSRPINSQSPKQESLSDVQKSWKVLVRAARRDLTESELLKVSLETLRKLTSLYRINTSDGELIENYWNDARFPNRKPPSVVNQLSDTSSPTTESVLHEVCY